MSNFNLKIMEHNEENLLQKTAKNKVVQTVALSVI